ncbi:MAG: FHA domain-containing protein [Solirubrobacteraceae bacterium]
MTIPAQPTSRPQGPPHAAERPTLGLDAQSPYAVDAFQLLDHRTRAHAVLLEAALPGRYLSIEHGEELRLIALARPIIHLGRGLKADIRIADPQVSRRHAIIAQRDDGARVLDDRSSNGTFVNGREVTVVVVNDGDVLRLGRVVFRLVEIQSPVRARPLRRFPLAAVGRRRVSVGADAD